MLNVKGLGFEVDGLQISIWNKFKTEFNSEVFQQAELPNYFGPFIDDLLKNGWVSDARTQLRNKNKANISTKKVKLSSMEVLEEKMTNFMKQQSDRGQIVTFNVVVKCPYCLVESPITAHELSIGLAECANCKDHYNI